MGVDELYPATPATDPRDFATPSRYKLRVALVIAVLQKFLDEHKEPTPYLRALRVPVAAGPALHFQEGDDHKPSMWATHPPNRDREIEAKRRYVAAEPLPVPAWRLVRDAAAIREELTVAWYAQALERHPRRDELLDAAACEALAAEERAEMKQAEHYHGLYDDRIVRPGKIAELIAELEAAPVAAAALRDELTAWRGAALERRMAAHAAREERVAELHGKLDDNPRPAVAAELKLALATAEQELQRDFDELAAADRAAFRYFYVASGAAPEAREELVARYGFLVDVQELLTSLRATEADVIAVVGWLREQERIDEEQLREAQELLRKADGELGDACQRAKTIAVPRLAHMDGARNVAEFMVPRRPEVTFGGDSIHMSEVAELGRTLDDAQRRLRKLHFKNLGALLRLQDGLDPSLVADQPPPSPTNSMILTPDGPPPTSP